MIQKYFKKINKKVQLKIKKRYFKKKRYFTFNSIIKSKMIQGENKRYINPILYPYLLAIRVKWVIIDPFLIQKSIYKCLKLIDLMVKKKQKILIIGNSFDIQFLLAKNLHFKKTPFIFFYKDTWLSGGLTNQKQKSKKLKDLRLNKFSLIIFLKARTNRHDLFREMIKLNVPVISLVPTNLNFTGINKILYPIVMNCYSTKSLFFFIYLLRKIIYQNHSSLKHKYATF